VASIATREKTTNVPRRRKKDKKKEEANVAMADIDQAALFLASACGVVHTPFKIVHLQRRMSSRSTALTISGS
jgi:hypothetical protein